MESHSSSGEIGFFAGSVKRFRNILEQTAKLSAICDIHLQKMRLKVRCRFFFIRKSFLGYGSCCFLDVEVVVFGKTHVVVFDCSFHRLLDAFWTYQPIHGKSFCFHGKSSLVLLSPEDSFVELSPKCTRNLGGFE